MEFETIFKLCLSAALPALVTAVLLKIENTRAAAASESAGLRRQLICGLVFGAVAVAGTELGIEMDGAIVNVRDAAPLCAALIFGGPAGILAGIIGGAERALAVLWGAGAYTQAACSVATVVAGIFGALLRRYVFEDRTPAWYFGLLAGFFIEVLDMLLIILTHLSDVAQAFYFVQICAFPMICLNGVSVMGGMAAAALTRGRRGKSEGEKGLAQAFQGWLAGVVVAAFLLTTGFTWLLQTQLSRESVGSLLSANLTAVENQADDNMISNMLLTTAACRSAAEDVPEENLSRVLDRLLWQYEVAEINLISREGVITASTNPEYIGFDMTSGEQSGSFYDELRAGRQVVQQLSGTTFDPSVARAYAGMPLENQGYVQVGFSQEQLASQWAEQTGEAARVWTVGESGYIVIARPDGSVVSDGDRGAATLAEAGIHIPEGTQEGQIFQDNVFSQTSYCMYETYHGYMLIGVLPLSEAYLERDMSVYLTVFTEISVFVILFLVVYCLVRYLVVANVRRVNAQLEKITAGDLETVVDVRPNQEFSSLSDGINATVGALKQSIAREAARIDAELELARAIQMGALPRIFPPFPDQKQFEIYAMERTAKEVGGDFYDFYMLGEDRVAMLIADVSGKGVPAALFMMSAKSLIKSLADSGLSVEEVFTRANQELCEHNEAAMFVTAWMGIADLRSGTLEFANAGHNAPLVCAPGGRFEYLRGARRGFVLGGMEGMTYKRNTLTLEPGTRIFLYTDGVTEAVDADENMYGDPRLQNVLNEHAGDDLERLCLDVVESVDAFAGPEPQFDDITVLAFEFKARRNQDV